VFCYELKQAAIPLVAALPYRLHTYCIDFSSVRMETKMSPEGLKVLKFKKKKLCKIQYGRRLQGLYLGWHSKGEYLYDFKFLNIFHISEI